MARIHKYPFQITDRQTLAIPGNSVKLLRVGLSPDKVPCLWLEVDPSAPLQPLTLLVVGTGREAPSGQAHLGSFCQGPFVWHVYSEGKPLTLLPSES